MADPARRSALVQRDAVLLMDIERVYRQHHRVYGARKVWHQLLRREGITVARCTVEIYALSRRIVGWRAHTRMQMDLVLDALEQALHDRELDGRLVVHPDRGSQYIAMRYTERLADAGAVPSLGSVGDAYDNALAESAIGLFKTKVIHRRGPWRGFDDVEYATLE